MTQKSVAEEIYLYSLVTNDVKVSVLPESLPEDSDPTDDVFAFAYTITIENLGPQTVQLLERHWVIMSGNVQSAEVVGPGVVGVQPVIKPGESFQYTSGAVIQDPIGSMHGTYTFRSEDGEFIQVDIPEFDLVYPLVIH